MDAIQKDLYWLFNSPVLVHFPTVAGIQWMGDEQLTSAWQRIAPAVKMLHQQQDVLAQHPFLTPPKTHRLGDYFEWLVALWLVLDPHYTICARNFALRLPTAQVSTATQKEGMHTLGELDFVIRCEQTGELIHLEVAVKFYLQLSATGELSDYVGSNGNDRLDKKCRRMQWHQLQLTQNPQLKPLLDAQFSQPVTQRWGLMKGRIYYPEQAQLPNVQLETEGNLLPVALNSAHEKGYWLLRDDALFKQTDTCMNYDTDKRDHLRIQNTSAAEMTPSATHADSLNSPSFQSVTPVKTFDGAGSSCFYVPAEWLARMRAKQTTRYQSFEHAYAHALYTISISEQREQVFTVGEAPNDWFWGDGAECWLMTAHNPSEQVLSEQENCARQCILEQCVMAQGYDYLPYRSSDKQGNYEEKGCAILNPCSRWLKQMGSVFAQRALLKITRSRVELVWL